MGWLDNVIATVSPRRAYEREMWRQGLDELRGYDAAGHGRINSGWRAVNESAEITDRYSRDVVRARARDLERNSDIAQSVIYAYKRNVVGKGYTLRAMTGSDELDKRIEKAWNSPCRSPPVKKCHISPAQQAAAFLIGQLCLQVVPHGLQHGQVRTGQGPAADLVGLAAT